MASTKPLTLKDLERAVAAGQTPDLEVHGVELSLYLSYQRDGEQLTALCDRHGKTLRYKSREHALRALADIGVTTVDFVHRSVYSEMIGVEGDMAQTELRESLSLSSRR